MKATLFILAIISIFIFAGCHGKAQETVQNGDFKVEFLFEQDGCKVYRFKDGTRYVYWVNQTGKVNSDYTVNSGKSSHRVYVESITTDTSSNFIKSRIKKITQ